MKKLLTLSILILVMVSSFANVSPVAASPNTWSSAGSMTQTREEHTATLLEDGRVLVAGGSIDGQTNLASAELYDPATGTWTAAAPMTSGRSYHTATLLKNGKVLVAGGIGGGQSAELYDPASDTWTAAASMTISLASNTPPRCLRMAGCWSQRGLEVRLRSYMTPPRTPGCPPAR